jgi:endoglucanase
VPTPDRPTRSLAGAPSIAAALLLAMTAGAGAASPLAPGWIATRGTEFVDAEGRPVTLRGCNLGNWLLLEMWMLAIDEQVFPDQHSFEANLEERFGEAEKDRLMELYRENWITPRDFALIRSFGFNVVRLPFHHGLVEDPARPGTCRESGLAWLDRAIAMAEAAGIHLILDMHGVPGGQSIDHPTGRVGQNHLWGDPDCVRRTVSLWRVIAERYRDRPAVAGYDVINEPFGDMKTDVRPRLKAIFEDIYRAIRGVDERHVVFAPAPLWGGHGFYGDPHEQGWINVAFTEHHYPGIFGSPPTPRTHANFIHRVLPAKQAELRAANTPLLVGEWNPVFERLGGGDLVRRYFDEYARLGWGATIWSYKLLRREGGVIDDNWHLVSNARPLEPPDFRIADAAAIAAYFRSLATMEYVIDEPLRLALTRETPVPVPLPVPPEPLSEAPHHDRIAGWTGTDIGDAVPGGQRRDGDRAMTVYGGGSDIWGEADSFRFLHRPHSGDFTLTATVTSLADTHDFAKAGLMARGDLSADAAHVLVHVIPGGRVVLGHRDRPGEKMTETSVEAPPLPVRLRLRRRDGLLTGAYAAPGEAWKPIGQPLALPAVAGPCRIGFAVLSHRVEGLTAASFTDTSLGEHPAGETQPAQDPIAADSPSGTQAAAPARSP